MKNDNLLEIKDLHVSAGEKRDTSRCKSYGRKR